MELLSEELATGKYSEQDSKLAALDTSGVHIGKKLTNKEYNSSLLGPTKYIFII